MKILLTLLLLTFISTSLSAQKNNIAEEIINKSIETVSKIEKGSYKIDYRMKYMDRKDTFDLSAICYFEKEKEIKYGAKLNIQQLRGITYIYNGKEIFVLNRLDSSALAIETAKDGYGYIEGNIVNALIYSPLINESFKKLVNSKDIEFINLGEDTSINKKLYYHLIVKTKNDGDVKNIFTDYFIDKSSFLPVRKITKLDWRTQHQYEEYNLSEIKENSLPSTSEALFSAQSIPEYYTITNYITPKPKTIEESSLQPGIIAPDFQLNSLNGETVQLNKLKGKIVMLDFSYQSCYGCKLALPELQKFHKKYNKKGLVILGINPVDTSAADYKEYLDKQNIEFSFSLAQKELANIYKVQAYPTFYLIDTSGKIILSETGYSKDKFAKLEKQIQKQLKDLNKIQN